jgi:hypothetical protein
MLNMAFLVGCSVTDYLTNNLDVCSLINCDQLGIVDYTGTANPIDVSPDYDSDPLCTVPGLCGSNYWYPNATSTATDTTSTMSDE